MASTKTNTMTLLDNEASSTGKSHLSKKLLVKDKLFSKITFSSAKRGVVELATNTNQDNIVSVAQSGVIMIKDPDKGGGGGLTNGHLGELPLELNNIKDSIQDIIFCIFQFNTKYILKDGGF